MSDLVFIAFPSEQKAEEVRDKVLEMQKEYLIELGDAVVAVKDSSGRIKLNQLVNTTATGAISGAFWGTLIGLIFLNPLLGTALGAASGALGGSLTDVGINDDFMKEAAGALQPGTAGLFLLVRKMTTDKVLADLRGIGGTVMRTSFDETKEAALREALAGRAAAAPRRRHSLAPVLQLLRRDRVCTDCPDFWRTASADAKDSAHKAASIPPRLGPPRPLLGNACTII